MQRSLQCSCGQGLHRSSGLQKAQAIRMTLRTKGQEYRFSASRSERVSPHHSMASEPDA